ncbi:MAG: winged helix-turn-helix domain-containing protein [Gemmatimonadaceae bacterium]|nr:winged helix-turn-helix domain-containing protein [Gemmatimonadaceae bacterium]
MPPITLRLLGTPVVERDGAPVVGVHQQRRVIALLALLAAQPDEPFTKERLIALLWPDADVRKGRHALNQLVYLTRRLLGEAECITGVTSLQLDPALVTSDLQAADAAVAAGDDVRMVELHRGPLLDGFSLGASPAFEHWLVAERQRRIEQSRPAMLRLAEAAWRDGATERAQEILSRRLAMAPTDADAVALRVRVLLDAGAASDARRTLDVYAQSLRAQGVVELPEPLAALRAGLDAELGPAPSVLASAGRIGTPRLGLRLAQWLPVPIGLVIGVSVLLGLQRGTVPASAPVTTEIAVLPFRVTGASPELRWVEAGIVELLAPRIGEATGRSIAEPGRTLRLWQGVQRNRRDVVTVDEARDLARSALWRRVVVGAATGNARRLTLTAQLIDVETGQTIASGIALGPVDSLGRIVATLAAGLASGERRTEVPLGSTPPLTAIRRYLDGVDAERRGRLADASAAYRAAIAVDSSFAEAALRLAFLAARRNAAEPDDAALALAVAHRDQLSPTDRTLLNALAGPRYPAPTSSQEQRVAWELVAASAPDRADAWQTLGRLYLTHGAAMEMPSPYADAKAALERSLALDGAVATWRPLAAALALGGNRDSMIAARSRVPATALVARAVLDGALGDSAGVVRLRRQLPRLDDEAVRDAAIFAQFGLLPLDIGRAALTTLRGRTPRATELVDLALAEHSDALAREDTLARRRALAALDGATPASGASRRLRLLDAMFAGVDTAMAPLMDSLARGLQRMPLDARDEAARLADRCLLALAQLHQGDAAAAERTSAPLKLAPPMRVTTPVATPPMLCAALVESGVSVARQRIGARRKLAAMDSLALAGGAVGDAARWADLLIGSWYRQLGDSAAARSVAARRPVVDGWPRYLRQSRALEGETP